MDAFEILVLILGVQLAVFLSLGIAVFILLIGIFKQLKKTGESAQHIVENVQAFTDSAKTVVGGSIIASALAKILRRANKK